MQEEAVGEQDDPEPGADRHQQVVRVERKGAECSGGAEREDRKTRGGDRHSGHPSDAEVDTGVERAVDETMRRDSEQADGEEHTERNEEGVHAAQQIVLR
jgi:hypothetical protein